MEENNRPLSGDHGHPKLPDSESNKIQEPAMQIPPTPQIKDQPEGIVPNQPLETKADKKQKKKEKKEKVPKEKKERTGGNATLPWVLVIVLILVIAGGIVWFCLFADDTIGSSSSSDKDEDKEKVEKTEEVAKNKVKGDNFVTPDLIYNDLKGPVMLVRNGTDWGYGPYFYTEYFYDNNGQWINIPIWQGDEKKNFRNQDNKYQKDNNGYIVLTANADSEGEGESYPTTTSITWENGKITHRLEETRYSDSDYYYYNTTNTDYTYDDKGLLTKEIQKNNYSTSYSSGSSETSNSYSYLKFDDHGNWTKRLVNSKSKYDDNTPYTNSYTEIRDIKYYE